MRPSVRSTAYYTVSFQVELFYGLQDTTSVVDRRNKCNQDKATIQKRDFGAFRRRRHSSATCRMMPTPPRPPSPSPTPPPRANKFAGRTSSSSSIINFIPCARPMLAVPIRQTHVVHPSIRVSAFIAGTTRPRRGKTNLQIGPLGYA